MSEGFVQMYQNISVLADGWNDRLITQIITYKDTLQTGI